MLCKPYDWTTNKNYSERSRRVVGDTMNCGWRRKGREMNDLWVLRRLTPVPHAHILLPDSVGVDHESVPLSIMNRLNAYLEFKVDPCLSVDQILRLLGYEFVASGKKRLLSLWYVAAEPSRSGRKVEVL